MGDIYKTEEKDELTTLLVKFERAVKDDDKVKQENISYDIIDRLDVIANEEYEKGYEIEAEFIGNHKAFFRNTYTSEEIEDVEEETNEVVNDVFDAFELRLVKRKMLIHEKILEIEGILERAG